MSFIWNSLTLGEPRSFSITEWGLFRLTGRFYSSLTPKRAAKFTSHKKNAECESFQFISGLCSLRQSQSIRLNAVSKTRQTVVDGVCAVGWLTRTTLKTISNSFHIIFGYTRSTCAQFFFAQTLQFVKPITIGRVLWAFGASIQWRRRKLHSYYRIHTSENLAKRKTLCAVRPIHLRKTTTYRRSR